MRLGSDHVIGRDGADLRRALDVVSLEKCEDFRLFAPFDDETLTVGGARQSAAQYRRKGPLQSTPIGFAERCWNRDARAALLLEVTFRGGHRFDHPLVTLFGALPPREDAVLVEHHQFGA